MRESNTGFILALPSIMILFILFAAPLVLIIIFSFQQPYSFDINSVPTIENYAIFFSDGYYKSLGWSVFLSMITVFISFLFAYPCAYGMVKIFPRYTLWIALLIAMPMFVSSGIRLFGWTLILQKGGFLPYLLSWIPGIVHIDFLYHIPAIVLGLVYIYGPFMLFPLILGIQMVDEEAREAAVDLGASRWSVLIEVELPMAAAGIFFGALLVFVTSLGTIVEAQILGGGAVVPFSDDMYHAFAMQQNWPLGSSLAVIMLIITLVLIVVIMHYVDLDKLLGSRAKLG